MLETLDDVPWAALTHAYGSAADVPESLRALRDPDPEVRGKARYRLYGNIFHQGSRYPASAHAVPFLLELAGDPQTAERAEIVDLLSSLAIGYDESWLPGPFPVAEYRAVAAGGDRLLQAAPPPTDDDTFYQYGESLDDADRERMFTYIELSVFDALRAGVPLLCTLLTDDDPALRVAAAYALAWFGEDAATSTGPLTTAAADPDAAVAATALVALGLIGADIPALPADRREPLGADTSALLADGREPVRWAAAVALARLHGPAADPAVAAELLAWAGGDRGVHAGIPFLDGDLAGYAGLALRRLGDNRADAAFEALLSRIPSVNGPEALPVVGEALRHAFPAGPIPDGTRFADLDPRQQRLARALADSPATWGWGEHGLFANFMSLVGAYGLPRRAEEMCAFVTQR